MDRQGWLVLTLLVIAVMQPLLVDGTSVLKHKHRRMHRRSSSPQQSSAASSQADSSSSSSSPSSSSSSDDSSSSSSGDDSNSPQFTTPPSSCLDRTTASVMAILLGELSGGWFTSSPDEGLLQLGESQVHPMASDVRQFDIEFLTTSNGKGNRVMSLAHKQLAAAQIVLDNGGLGDQCVKAFRHWWTRSAGGEDELFGAIKGVAAGDQRCPLVFLHLAYATWNFKAWPSGTRSFECSMMNQEGKKPSMYKAAKCLDNNLTAMKHWLSQPKDVITRLMSDIGDDKAETDCTNASLKGLIHGQVQVDLTMNP